ncbi:MAG: hypothetical protein AB8G05_17065 [Oligoflexales bacterium]
MLLKFKFTILSLACLISASFSYGFSFNLSDHENYRKNPDRLVEQITNKLCNHEEVETDLDELKELVNRAENLNLQSMNNIKKFAQAMQKDFQKSRFLRSQEFKKAQLIAEEIDNICVDTIDRRSNLQAPHLSNYDEDSLEKYLADARSFIISSLDKPHLSLLTHRFRIETN